MGGLIGGAYASGMSPAEIRSLLATADWDLMFLGETPYQQRDLRRREDRRGYPMRVEFGLKGGFRMPPGLDSGQQVTFLLQRIALPYYAMASFDELPTPFRCVATDMEKGEPVVLGSGSLSRAMRATMSLPTAFAPIVIDGRLLADGGILNNVPVDVARAQGADVVIAVNVGSAPHTREQMMSLFGMLGQTLDVAMSDSSRAIARTADVLVQPAVADIGSLDFRRHKEIADLGYQGASEVTALLKYAVDDATWNQWLNARAARRKINPPTPEFIRITGVGDKVDTREIEKGLQRFLGSPLDQEAIGLALTRVTGDGLFSAVTYDAIRENGRDGLLVHIDEKLTGPPLLNIALEVSNRASKGLSFDPAFRVTSFNTLTRNSELRLDGSFGTRMGVGAEHYQRLGLSRFFVAPAVGAERRITEYFADGEALAEYEVQRYGMTADAGVRLNADTELRAGYIFGRVDVERGIGAAILPEFSGLERRTHVLLRHDSQSRPFAPSSGLLAVVEYSYWDRNPIREGGFGQLDGRSSVFHAIGTRDRVFAQFSAGTSFGANAPVPYKFALGGLYRLSGYENDEFRGDHYLLAGAGYMKGIGRLPDLLGGPIFATAAIDVGSAFDTWDAARGRASLGVGLAMDTLVGPISAQIAFDKDGGSRFYFVMGRTVPVR
jgi:NTE family protein